MRGGLFVGLLVKAFVCARGGGDRAGLATAGRTPGTELQVLHAWQPSAGGKPMASWERLSARGFLRVWDDEDPLPLSRARQLGRRWTSVPAIWRGGASLHSPFLSTLEVKPKEAGLLGLQTLPLLDVRKRPGKGSRHLTSSRRSL